MSLKGGVKTRREKALVRLEKQLKSGIKPYEVVHLKKGKTKILGKTELSESDRARIKKEISILKSKV